MPTYTTRGRARVTITELPGPGLGVVLAGVLIGAAVYYARTILQAIEIMVAVLFGLTVAAVITGTVLVTRRIIRECRPAPVARRAVSAATAAAPQLSHAAAPRALPGADEITVRPEWATPARKGPRP